MNELTVEDLLEMIMQEDARYTINAYHFVREGLDYTVKNLQEPRHVSGGELLDGIREYALEEYGPLSKRVLSEWGINSCSDIGHIVFNLVNVGLLGKTEDDSLSDFEPGYDFNDAFLRPFQPVKVH